LAWLDFSVMTIWSAIAARLKDRFDSWRTYSEQYRLASRPFNLRILAVTSLCDMTFLRASTQQLGVIGIAASRSAKRLRWGRD
jgi:hypothetical protein